MRAVNARIDALLGPFDGWYICPHAPEDDCACRKPKPKLILDAARALGVEPKACLVVGDRESDLQAARNAGAMSIKVNGPRDLAKAVEVILAGSPATTLASARGACPERSRRAQGDEGLGSEPSSQ